MHDSVVRTVPPPDTWLLDEVLLETGDHSMRVLVVMDQHTRRVQGWSIVDPIPDETQVYLTYEMALRDNLGRATDWPVGPRVLIIPPAPWYEFLHVLDQVDRVAEEVHTDAKMNTAAAPLERWFATLRLTFEREYPPMGDTARDLRDWLADYIESYNRGRDA